MKNIIKSDLYYYRKNIKYFLAAGVILVLYFGMGEIGVNTYDYKGENDSVYQMLQLIFKQNFFYTVVANIILVSVMQGKIQANRFYMYQMMNARTEEVLFSKYVIQFLYNFILCAAAYGMAAGILSFVTHQNLYLAFLKTPYCLMVIATEIILLFNFTIQTVSIVLWVKNGIWGAILNWLIITTAMMPVLLYSIYGEWPVLLRISEWLLPGQTQLVVMQDMAYGIMVKSVITTVVKTILFWFLTVSVVKRKEFT